MDSQLTGWPHSKSGLKWLHYSLEKSIKWSGMKVSAGLMLFRLFNMTESSVTGHEIQKAGV